jgi:hypothetical protein
MWACAKPGATRMPSRRSPPPDYAEILAAIRDGRFARFRSLEEVNAYVGELRQDRDDVAP